MNLTIQPTYFYVNKNVSQPQKVAPKNNQPSFMRLPSAAYKDLVVKVDKVGPKIKSKEEYVKLLDEIYDYKSADGKHLFDYVRSKKEYPNATKEQEGLLLYAGVGDLSDDINRFLSGREMKKMNEKQAKNVVKVLDYSLEKLDKSLGKFSGVVYRQGFFPKNAGQFISTTKDPVIAATLRGGICHNKDMEFSVIKVKEGHKINKFQKKMGSAYADEEDEILLSRTNRYIQVAPVGEMWTLTAKFKRILESFSKGPVSDLKVRVYEQL